MVALKRDRVPKPQTPVSGSRNAVVALKPLLGLMAREASVTKQERRGGIETGGIAYGGAGGNSGSRNAVVALKPQAHRDSSSIPTRSRNAVVALKQDPTPPTGGPACYLKQERRGGIETGADLSRIRMAGDEAGTPWWH